MQCLQHASQIISEALYSFKKTRFFETYELSHPQNVEFLFAKEADMKFASDLVTPPIVKVLLTKQLQFHIFQHFF